LTADVVLGAVAAKIKIDDLKQREEKHQKSPAERERLLRTPKVRDLILPNHSSSHAEYMGDDLFR